MILIDTHCHLEVDELAQAAPILERAKAQGVVHSVIVGQLQQPGDFGQSLPLARAHRGWNAMFSWLPSTTSPRRPPPFAIMPATWPE